VANEGKLVAFVPAVRAQAMLAAMRANPDGTEAVMIDKIRFSLGWSQRGRQIGRLPSGVVHPVVVRNS
jgi:hydrogenase maturation factor